MAEFDRANPLWEKSSVPFEVIATPPAGGAAKKHGNFTVRILQGHRRSGDGDRERVVRFEMSDECHLIDESPSPWAGSSTPGDVGPSANAAPRQHTPHAPVIHAPFMTLDRGRVGPAAMQSHGQRCGHPGGGVGFHAPKPVPNRPIELYELEVGESDFADLRRDQALLVDFNDFANSLISLLQLCELGGDSSSQPREHAAAQETFHDADNYGQQHSDFSMGTNGQASHPAGYHVGTWHTPSQTRQGTPLNQQRHGPGASTPYANMNAWSQTRQGTPLDQQRHGPGASTPYATMNVAMPVSTYSCRLETNVPTSPGDGMQWRNAQQSNASLHAGFSIMESNQFRELTHLALTLNVGTDKTVDCTCRRG